MKPWSASVAGRDLARWRGERNEWVFRHGRSCNIRLVLVRDRSGKSGSTSGCQQVGFEDAGGRAEKLASYARGAARHCLWFEFWKRGDLLVTRKQRRMAWVISGLLALGAAVGLVLLAARDAVVFFFSPSELVQREIAADYRVRMGGLVAIGSVRKDGEVVRFVVTDMAHAITVLFTGILPDLFREGRGVVVEGRLGTDGIFQASGVLAKHDETYMPREVAAALKKGGQWQGSVPPATADLSPPTAAATATDRSAQ